MNLSTDTYDSLPYDNGNTPHKGYPYPKDSSFAASSATLGRSSFQESAPIKPGSSKDGAFTVDMRQVNRTPSPTPSEVAELNKGGLVDWKAMKHKKFWFRREWLWYYIIGIVLIVLFALMTIYHEQIVHWLQPAANWMHDLPAGFLIPIAIFFVISFPPLFGHEILAILCGVVWGLWVGFAITAAGTFLGEIGNFYAFKWCCRSRAEKMEKKDIRYACLAHVVREGGFKIALIARYSAIPGHFTTAVFSTCGMGFWTFAIAAVLSLPKQFVTVYLGVALEQSADGKPSRKDQIIKWTILILTGVVTIGAMWYINKQMTRVKPDVIYARRKARQQKMESASSSHYSGSTAAFNPNDSDSNLPLFPNSDGSYQHQQWDSSGRAVGYSGDPTLYAPQPQRATARPFDSGAASSSDVQLAPPSDTRNKYSPASGSKAPQRQDTAQSWDAEAAAGEQNAYKMTRKPSPPTDPFASAMPLPPRLPPPGSNPTSPPQAFSRPGSQPQHLQSAYGGAANTPPLPSHQPSYAPPTYENSRLR